MRRALPLVFLAVALLSACGSVAPSPRLSPSPPASPSPAPSRSPTAAPSQEAQIDEGGPSPVPPPLAYDWSKFPRLPTPTLHTAHDSVPAAAVAGCVTHLYEPSDDPFGRTAQSVPACLTGPLPRTSPLVVAAGEPLAVRAPHGYMLGAEVVVGAESYVIVSASRAIPARLDGLNATSLGELARESGFGLVEILFAAPTEPGEYLVAVAAQIGRLDRRYRELNTVFLYRIDVTAD